MDIIPAELVAHLCRFLDKPSLCNVRLTCRAFAIIAEERLFHDLEFRLHPSHHQLYQLEQLAANLSIASRLSCISFESGVQLEYADYRYWQAQVYHDKSRAWEASLARKGSTRAQYLEFHESLQARFTADLPQKYDLYRWHLDQQASLMAKERIRDLLVRTLNKVYDSCPSLSFKLVMSEPQISLEQLEAFSPEEYASEKPYDPDPRRRVANRRQHCLAHFFNLLDAANRSRYEVNDLTALDMPHQLFTVNGRGGSHALHLLEGIFAGLKRLELSVSAFPHSDWLSRNEGTEIYILGRNSAARRLRMLLNCPSNLEELCLTFPSGKEAEYSFELFDRTNIDRFPRLWLAHVQSLTLCDFRCSWQDLKAFLMEAKHLRSLMMKNCWLETCSMVDLFDFLATRSLARAEVLGQWYVEEDSGQWHFHDESDFTKCSAATSYEGPYVHSGLRAKVQEYIHGSAQCPLPPWTVPGNAGTVWETLGDTSAHYIPGRPQL
ncbi:hypothetical protein PV11_01959 [Exophiala sideris]|uniref:F-box domain-containing protein n=1 Tax=Exophiala sideris TaxID=1016849 RepID=A0A0D1YXN6_9EURO|nr:hypothetical protein PV11_01959 [Exophiala sideris]